MGRKVGASGRTLSRLFVEETGLTFSQWRTNARMRVALTRLAAGDPIRPSHSTPATARTRSPTAFGCPPVRRAQRLARPARITRYGRTCTIVTMSWPIPICVVSCRGHHQRCRS
ncbi:MAG: helix-turn-helix domain-containing protein [Pseudonocardia sp.]